MKFIRNAVLLLLAGLPVFINLGIIAYFTAKPHQEVDAMYLSAALALFGASLVFASVQAITRAAALSLGLLQAITLIVVFAMIYRSSGLAEGGQTKEISFRTALYFSTVTWTTVGYGDFVPPENIRLIAGLEALLGYIYLAYAIAIMASSRQEASPQGGGGNGSAELYETERLSGYMAGALLAMIFYLYLKPS